MVYERAAASGAATEATVGWNSTKARAKLYFCRAMFSWTRSLYAICVCVQFNIFSVPCWETNMYCLTCRPHLICLYSFFASLITRAKIVLVSVLWMFFLLPKGFGPLFSTSRRRYKMAQTLKKPHTKALSPYVTTEPCNNTCLGTALLPLLMIGTSFSCPFP